MGTYLVTVHHPISTDDGDLEKALYGSFLPIPSNDIFPLPEATVYEEKAQPGAIVAVKGEAGSIKLNQGRKRISLKVKSMGDRPIQVASRNSALKAMLIRSSGRITLPLHRNKPASSVRSRTSTRLPTRHTCRHFGSLRAWRYQDCHIGPNWRQSNHKGWKPNRFRLHQGHSYCRGNCGKIKLWRLPT